MTTNCDLLVFGVDGLSNKVIQMYTRMNEEIMPTFKQLQDQQDTAYGDFESYIVDGYDHPHTGPCWITLYTGLKPEEHGMTEGGWREGESHFHEINTVWDKLTEATDNTMALYGMPMTYRAKKINGWMVSGFVHTTLKSLYRKHAVHPEDIVGEDFIENTATYVAKCEMKEGVHPQMPEDSETAFEHLIKAEQDRLNEFQEIIREDGAPNIVAYGTTFADKMGHADSINPANELTEQTYRFIDDLLSDLIDILDPDEIIIISDHGFSGWTHDLYGYYLDTTGKGMDSIFDFTPLILNHFGLEYSEDEYGPEGELEGLTEEEKEDAKERLKDLGYATEDDA